MQHNKAATVQSFTKYKPSCTIWVAPDAHTGVVGGRISPTAKAKEGPFALKTFVRAKFEFAKPSE